MAMDGRKYSPTNYRYGFNGKEKDDEVKVHDGTSYDFGARIYDPRIGRWLSVDKAATHYAPISPYILSLNNPIIFRDRDGNIVIGADGKAVTYTRDANNNIKWSANATQDVQRIGNAMLKTRTGTQVFTQMQNAAHPIKIVIDPSYNPKEQGLTEVERTWNSTTNEWDPKSATITIYEGNFKRMKQATDAGISHQGIQGKLYDEVIKQYGNYEAAMGATGAHEGIHGSSKTNIKQTLLNKFSSTRLYDTEAKPEGYETEFLKESLIINMETKVVTEIKSIQPEYKMEKIK
ncbi:MAG: hypothetical protein JST49_13275 [Bacteroidetes bacterium]|nr:hypothetical protein [Bacteroidota bacterium]